jgi:hypothetical protein
MTLPGVGRLGVLALAWSALAAPDTAMAATDVADQSFPLSLVAALSHYDRFRRSRRVARASGLIDSAPLEKFIGGSNVAAHFVSQ